MRRWLQLSWAERRMLLAAALATTVARVALVVVPWPLIRPSATFSPQVGRRSQEKTVGIGSQEEPVGRNLQRALLPSARGEGARRADEGSPIDLVSWAVGVCARRLPWATCLSNALAVRWLLARRGIAASIELGTYDDGGTPHFHARVICEGREIAGEREMVVLASLDA